MPLWSFSPSPSCATAITSPTVFRCSCCSTATLISERVRWHCPSSRRRPPRGNAACKEGAIRNTGGRRRPSFEKGRHVRPGTLPRPERVPPQQVVGRDLSLSGRRRAVLGG